MKFSFRPFACAVLAVLSLVPSSPAFAGAADLPAGTAKGTFAPEGKPAVTLTSAVAFVDVKDDDKPVIVILSDKKLPAEKWTSEFDLMEAHPKFSGVAFWFAKDGTVFRCDIYDDGQQASVSGYFTLKLEGAFGKNLAGAVSTDAAAGSGPKADATFHVTVK